MTHRCPLHCVYCSNPLQLKGGELPTEEWLRVLDQAHRLGVVQLHLSGGEPLVRPDLEQVVRRARELDGLEQITLVASANLPAQRLYKALGFESYGIEPHSLKIGNAYIDDVLMVLWL